MSFFPAYGISVALSVNDYQQMPVVWSETNYTEHLTRHPEREYLKSDYYIGVIETTIQHPYKVDKKDDCTILYSDGITDQTISNNTLYMKVIVAYDYYPDHVRTAFLTTYTRGATMVYSG